ncbi:hypothetical protein [Curtobacterium flaccumfaciens]|uniref:hypothetical protein n=1 Tax=Curtobacterium flaccumfaciens TaxID=2035 RepID=UPI003879B7E7
MNLELDHLAIGQDPGAILPPISAVAGPGVIGVVAVETEQTPVVAALVAGGRMRSERGRLLVDGAEDRDRVRSSTVLVDAPGVAEPFPVLTVRQICREELVFAGHRGSRDAVDTVLDGLGLAHLADTPIQRVPTDARMRLLIELALLRPGVEALVVTSPERHGGSVEAWYPELQSVAQRGITVVLITSRAAAEVVERLARTSKPDTAPDVVPVDETDERSDSTPAQETAS